MHVHGELYKYRFLFSIVSSLIIVSILFPSIQVEQTFFIHCNDVLSLQIIKERLRIKAAHVQEKHEQSLNLGKRLFELKYFTGA